MLRIRSASLKIMQKKSENRGLLTNQIPDLQVYAIKTPLIERISIKTGFPWSQKPPY